MMREPEKDTLVILDFDGTLYRGLFPFFFRGIANADLMIALCLLGATRSRHFFYLLGSAIRLVALERQTRRAYLAGKMSLSGAERRLVNFFATRVIAYCTPEDLDCAAAAVSRLCYRSAWCCLARMTDRCDFAVVSKSFEFLLKHVNRRAAEHGLSLAYCGNRARSSGAPGRPLGSVSTKKDKRDRVFDLLARRVYRRAVVIGDTEDDIVMRDAGIAVLGASGVIFVALNAKDRRIAETADCCASSWREVGVFLTGWLDGEKPGIRSPEKKHEDR